MATKKIVLKTKTNPINSHDLRIIAEITEKINVLTCLIIAPETWRVQQGQPLSEKILELNQTLGQIIDSFQHPQPHVVNVNTGHELV